MAFIHDGRIWPACQYDTLAKLHSFVEAHTQICVMVMRTYIYLVDCNLTVAILLAIPYIHFFRFTEILIFSDKDGNLSFYVGQSELPYTPF